MNDVTMPRQGECSLLAALGRSAMLLRAEAAQYRNPHSETARRLDKNVRKGLAATSDDYARLIEAEISRLNPLPAITRLNGGES